jgi:cyclic pyranopterin monophosphate synthase
MSELTHFNAEGEARMVDVGNKPVSRRVAIAEGRIRMDPATLAMIEQGGHRKGDVLGVARIAGIMAAKRTSELIPLCHPLEITRVEMELESRPAESALYCRATVETAGRTGVEMEALCAVQIGLLTVYDMCKAVDRGMTIEAVRLLEKSGGRSGAWSRPADTD